MSEDWRDALKPRFLPGWMACIDCGDGWRDLILNLVNDLDRRGIKFGINQIKEKFGGLRFYYEAENQSEEKLELIHELVNAAEAVSYTICEQCGNGGKQRDGGWIKTLCDGCNKNRKWRATQDKT